MYSSDLVLPLLSEERLERTRASRSSPLLIVAALLLVFGSLSGHISSSVALVMGMLLMGLALRPQPTSVLVRGLPVVPAEAVTVDKGLSGTADEATNEAADNELVFSVNGVEQRLRDPSPSMLLSGYLRSLGLTGTKVACGEGGCGSCTVIAVGDDGVPRPINACLRLLCACDGLSITTTEGLGSRAAGFSAVQAVIAKGHGSQCGFCTPGWVGAMSALLARHAKEGGGAPVERWKHT